MEEDLEDQRLHLFRGASLEMTRDSLMQAGWPYNAAYEMAMWLTRQRSDIPKWDRLRRFMES